MTDRTSELRLAKAGDDAAGRLCFELGLRLRKHGLHNLLLYLWPTLIYRPHNRPISPLHR